MDKKAENFKKYRRKKLSSTSGDFAKIVLQNSNKNGSIQLIRRFEHHRNIPPINIIYLTQNKL